MIEGSQTFCVQHCPTYLVVMEGRIVVGGYAGFSLGLNDSALRPVVFPQRPVIFSVPCDFPIAFWFLRAFVSIILSLKLQKAPN